MLLWAGVSGLLAFHAHPDDEVMSTGGALVKYAEAGEQVVVVTATDGAEGEVHNYPNPEEIAPRLAEVRAAELAESLLGHEVAAQWHFAGRGVTIESAREGVSHALHGLGSRAELAAIRKATENDPSEANLKRLGELLESEDAMSAEGPGPAPGLGRLRQPS